MPAAGRVSRRAMVSVLCVAVRPDPPHLNGSKTLEHDAQERPGTSSRYRIALSAAAEQNDSPARDRAVKIPNEAAGGQQVRARYRRTGVSNAEHTASGIIAMLRAAAMRIACALEAD